jgi:two-component system chemotaxis response regulator CheB
MAKKIRTIIIDDSKFIRTLFTGLLNQTPDIEVVDTARDYDDAIAKIKLHNPDVLTLDVEMSEMDGIKFLEKVMKIKPMPVLMISKLTGEGTDITLSALEMGAIDYLIKHEDLNNYRDLDIIKDDLVSKIRIAANAQIIYNPKTKNCVPANFEPSKNTPKKLIAIGASIGGVGAIRQILAKLPSNCPPILMHLNLSETFTKTLVNRLNTFSEVLVHAAKNAQQLKSGNAYIVPNNKYVTIEGNKINLHPATDNSSMDSMFNSAASFGKDSIGVILTGTGNNGAQGIAKIKTSGGFTIAQDKASCVVYEMPKIANDSGTIDVELPLDKIANEILKNCI